MVSKTVDYQKKRWSILIASCIINLCIGSIYAWSVFAAPMASHLKLDVGDLALVFTIANSVGPITMISGGKINDKFGPKWVIMFGGILYGIGFIMSGFSTSLTSLIISYGLGSGLGMGMIYGCTINNSIKFFPDKRGLIGGIVTAIYGLSSVIIPPVANNLINNVGVLSAFRYIGLVFLILICISALFIEKCPVDFRPDGWEPKEIKNALKIQDKNWKGMLKDPIFYIMIAMLTCGAFYGLMVISQASPIAMNLIKISPATAAICVSILALFNMAGRVIAGYISDIFGRVNTLTAMYLLSIAGFFIIINCSEGDLMKFMVGISIVGITFGAFMGIFPGFTADQFGSKNNSVNYGIMFIGFALAGAFGPVVLNKIYGNSGSYTYAFIACIGLAILGLALTFVYRGVSKRAV